MTQWQMLVCAFAGWLALRSLLQLAEAHRQRYRETFRAEQLAARASGNPGTVGKAVTASKTAAGKPGVGGAQGTAGSKSPNPGGTGNRAA